MIGLIPTIFLEIELFINNNKLYISSDNLFPLNHFMGIIGQKLGKNGAKRFKHRG